MNRYRSTPTTALSRRHPLMLLLIALVCSLQVFAAERLVVVADGASDYAIALAEADAEQMRIESAAEFLQQTVRKATGVTLPIVVESAVGEGKPAIYLGRSAAARLAGIDVDSVAGWSYHNRTVGRDIFLIGEDRPPKVAPGPRARTVGAYGSFKAVTAFVDDQMGVRFLFPGEYGIQVPTLDRLTVDADMDVTWSPLFKYIGGRMDNYFRRHQKDLNDTAFGFASHMFGGSEFLYDYGGHSYWHAVPKEVYWEDHPEYFAEVDGERQDGGHLCISNPDVRELMLQEMERQLNRGFQWVELEQTDGYVPCECDMCRAIHPDPGERLWIFHRELAVEMQTRCPGKTVMMTSYGPTRLPPTTFNSFPDNVAIRLTRYRPEDFAMWEEWGAKDVPKSLYTTSWFSIHPRVSAYVAVNQVRLYLKHNIKGMYLCGGIIQNGKGNWYPWGLGGPGYYAFFKALHDPNVKPEAMRAEYVNAAFGEAAAPMQNFFAALDERMDHFWWMFRADQWNSPPSRLAARGNEFCTVFYPLRTLKELDSSLTRAQDLANSPEVKARLKLVEVEYGYLKRLALVAHAYNAYQLNPSFDALALIEARVSAFEEMGRELYPDGKPIQLEGVPAPFSGAPRSAHRHVGVGAPFNWDFALLREKQVLPGVGMKRTKAARVTGIELDGKLDDDAWQSLPEEEMGEIAMGKPPHQTAFKVAYDDTGLYLAFRGEIAGPEALDRVSAVGHDGTAWRQENMELVIDPLGARRMYYHFIVNPIANSYLDRRFGYHEDPDHPLFQKFEWDWTGDWHYATHLDKERDQWTAELRIPFATLDVTAPEVGDVWTLNIGRNEFSAGGSGGTPVCYLWSPNLQSRTFHDPSVFGELIFR